jgi:hypothetical protein
MKQINRMEESNLTQSWWIVYENRDTGSYMQSLVDSIETQLKTHTK